MTYHPSSAVSVATVLTATAVIVAGHRAARTHAAAKEVRAARRAARITRRHAWVHTAQFLTGAVLILLTLFVAAYDAGR
jgi:hypothetical protein